MSSLDDDDGINNKDVDALINDTRKKSKKLRKQ